MLTLELFKIQLRNTRILTISNSFKFGRWYTSYFKSIHRQKLSNTTFFRRHCFGSCRTEYAGNGNQIFWFFFFWYKFYYFDEHFELKMILWTKYLDNSRPCTKQMKNDTEKPWKKFAADVSKIIFNLTFNSMESYHPEHLLVYYKFLKNLNLWRMYLTSGMGLLQDPPFYCIQSKNFCSIDNSIRRLLLLKIVLHTLFTDALYGLRPNSAYADPFWLICGGSICIKRPFSIQDGITLSRKSIPGHKSVLHIKVSLVERENI